jgi:hypothetical protein
MAKAIYTYTIPESLRTEGGPSSLGLSLLTVDQELTASKIGRFDTMKTQYEAAKMAIAQADGKDVMNGDGAIDVLWEKVGPKMRALVLQAYNEISSANGEEEAAFFKSRSVKVV